MLLYLAQTCLTSNTRRKHASSDSSSSLKNIGSPLVCCCCFLHFVSPLYFKSTESGYYMRAGLWKWGAWLVHGINRSGKMLMYFFPFTSVFPFLLLLDCEQGGSLPLPKSRICLRVESFHLWNKWTQFLWSSQRAGEPAVDTVGAVDFLPIVAYITWLKGGQV